MIRIALVDDDPMIHKKIRSIVESVCNDNIRCYDFYDASELEKSKVSFDLLLLDIEMPIMNGLEYSKKHHQTMIIFITNHAERMQDAFGLNIYGYVLKNELEVDLEPKLKAAIDTIARRRKVVLKTDQGSISFSTHDIIYAQYIGSRHINFVTKNAEYTIKGMSLDNFQRTLGDSFLFIERNTIINSDYIKKVEGRTLLLHGTNCRLEISTRRKKEIMKRFFERVKR